VIPVGITREGAFVLEDDDPAKFPLDAAHLPEVADNGTRVLWPEPGGDRTLRVVRQNFIWAASYNAACIPLALLGWLPPWAAGLGMASSSLVVVFNSLRLTR
jgi:hypothetical protein